MFRLSGQVHLYLRWLVFDKKWANFFVHFWSFQTNINTIFTTNQCEKCQLHPVYGARIRTHDLLIMSHLLKPLNQDSRRLGG